MQLNYLSHYGIKGQKWGIRRFQNEDGSLTPAGRKHYDVGPAEKSVESENSKNTSNKKIGKRQAKLESILIEEGYSPEEAAKKARNKVILERALIATAAVTATAAVSYAIYKRGKDRTDQMISAGDMMQRVEGFNPNFSDQSKRELWDVSYVSNNKFDNKNYLASYGYLLKGKYAKEGSNGEVYKLGINATKNLKIASNHSAAKSFTELSGNKKFAKQFTSDSDLKILTTSLHNKRMVSDEDARKFLRGEKLPASTTRKIYDVFNMHLTGAPETSTHGEMRNMFYSGLRKKGYSGLVDVNDSKYSGLRSKNPLIIFDSKKNLNIKEVTQVSKKQINEIAVGKSWLRTTGLDLTQKLGNITPHLAVGATGAAIGVSAFNGSSADNFIKKYMKEHPNTKLSKNEIEELREDGSK